MYDYVYELRGIYGTRVTLRLPFAEVVESENMSYGINEISLRPSFTDQHLSVFVYRIKYKIWFTENWFFSNFYSGRNFNLEILRTTRS